MQKEEREREREIYKGRKRRGMQINGFGKKKKVWVMRVKDEDREEGRQKPEKI